MTDLLAGPKGKPPTEHTEQSNLVRSVRLHLPKIAPALAAVPNGQLRDVRVAKRLKAEGQSNGYPDLLLDIPRAYFHGMRIEMKRINARPSDWKPEQRAWAELLTENGYLYVLGLGAADAFTQIQAYINLGPYHPDNAVDLDQFRLHI